VVSPFDDVVDLLAAGDLHWDVRSSHREFEFHVQVGYCNLFVPGIVRLSLARRSGKDFTMGRIIVPGSAFHDYYLFQGKRSSVLASEFTEQDLFLDLSTNFLHYRQVIEITGFFLEMAKSMDYIQFKRANGESHQRR